MKEPCIVPKSRHFPFVQSARRPRNQDDERSPSPVVIPMLEAF
jgi:hypothetical protein